MLQSVLSGWATEMLGHQSMPVSTMGHCSAPYTSHEGYLLPQAVECGKFGPLLLAAMQFLAAV